MVSYLCTNPSIATACKIRIAIILNIRQLNWKKRKKHTVIPTNAMKPGVIVVIPHFFPVELAFGLKAPLAGICNADAPKSRTLPSCGIVYKLSQGESQFNARTVTNAGFWKMYFARVSFPGGKSTGGDAEAALLPFVPSSLLTSGWSRRCSEFNRTKILEGMFEKMRCACLRAACTILARCVCIASKN